MWEEAIHLIIIMLWRLSIEVEGGCIKGMYNLEKFS